MRMAPEEPDNITTIQAAIELSGRAKVNPANHSYILIRALRGEGTSFWAYIPYLNTMACTMGSVAALGTKYHTCLGPHMRLRSVHRSFFLTPHRKEFRKISYHKVARQGCASSAPSGAGDEGHPVEADPHRGAVFLVGIAAAVVVAMVEFGGSILGAIGNLQFRPIEINPWSHQSSF